jgi:DNA repair protein RecO
MSTYLTRGFVLRMQPWRENARRYVVFTQLVGKIEVILAGGQKLVSKLASHLQPFSEVELMVAPGQKLDHLAGANLRQVYLKPQQNLASTVLASSLLEVVDILSQPGQAENNLFVTLRNYLARINELPTGPAWRPAARNLLAEFLLEAISHSGLSLHLKACEACGRPLDKDVNFNWQDHGFYHQNCLKPGVAVMPVTPATVAWLINPTGQEKAQAQVALAFLTDYFQGQVGRELYSLKVLRSILEI